MKRFFNFLAVLMLSFFSFVLPAAANILLIGRGTDVTTGIMHVSWSDNGELKRISRAELAANGVDIFNRKQVVAFLGTNSSFVGDGGCGSRNASGDCLSEDSNY